MPKISNFLVLRGNLSKALDFYKSVFSNDITVTSQTPYDPSSPQAGKIMSATIKIYNQDFLFFDFGPQDEPSKAVSFFIHCDGGQAEIDRLWDKLPSDGGEQLQCGWVKDQFGFYWQVVPKELGQLMSSIDRAKAQRVMEAVWKMNKIEIAELEKAAAIE